MSTERGQYTGTERSAHSFQFCRDAKHHRGAFYGHIGHFVYCVCIPLEKRQFKPHVIQFLLNADNFLNVTNLEVEEHLDQDYQYLHAAFREAEIRTDCH